MWKIKCLENKVKKKNKQTAKLTKQIIFVISNEQKNYVFYLKEWS